MEEKPHPGFVLLDKPTIKANLACAHCGAEVHQYNPPDARAKHVKACP